MKSKNRCDICNNPIEDIINLKDYPLTEGLVSEYINPSEISFDQKFQYCQKCNHGQLSNVLNKLILYSDKYSFRTNTSPSTKVNRDSIGGIIKLAKKYKLKKINEIGCNDGSLLKMLKNNFEELIGVDSVLKETKTVDNIKLIKGFIEDTKITFEDSLVVAYQVLEHIENPKSVIKDILNRSNNNTIFQFAFPSLDCLIHDKRFDQIFHHHVNYFSHNSICKLLESLDCQILDIDWNEKYWGSIIVTFMKGHLYKIKRYNSMSIDYILEQYEKFLENMDRVYKFIKSNKNVYCYGATYQFPILKYYIPNIKETLGILDDSLEKEGSYPLGVNLIIHNPSKVNIKDANICITASNFVRDILPNLIKKNPKKICLLIDEI